jgi:membrane protease YdiL (CAAX protease family)
VIGGPVFGWLFWKRGLMTAMLAHFSADIVLQVGLPVIRAFF